MKRIALLFLTVAFSLSLAQAASQPSANLRAGKKQILVAYGTSLTFGGAWVKQVQAALDARFPGQATLINSGGSGQYSKWGVDNLDRPRPHPPA